MHVMDSLPADHMVGLKRAILKLANNLHGSVVAAIIERLRANGGSLATEAITSSSLREHCGSLQPHLIGFELSCFELAALIEGISYGVQEERTSESVRLVWTGPEAGSIAPRLTSRALRELIDSAREDLFITSYASFPILEIENAIGDAVTRGVRVSMLLEHLTRDGSEVFRSNINRLRDALPGVSFYQWPASERPANAAMHAKCAIADLERCFISSANLTERAMDSNLEVGLLVEGGRVPGELRGQFESMIVKRAIEPVDAS